MVPASFICEISDKFWQRSAVKLKSKINYIFLPHTAFALQDDTGPIGPVGPGSALRDVVLPKKEVAMPVGGIVHGQLPVDVGAGTSHDTGIAGDLNMSFMHAFVASLCIIIVSELGDKTFFISAIMAMSHPRLTVFTGAMTALAGMHILSGEEDSHLQFPVNYICIS